MSTPTYADSPNGDDQLVTEVEGGKREGSVSMDVLLQVTLPIVLILAFLVVTEVQSLTDQINRLQKDIEGTATGRLSRERDLALLELQIQLLYAATTEVGSQTQAELGLDQYARLAPGVDEILNGNVAADFTASSRAVHAALGNDAARRRTEEGLRRVVEERFVELVEEQTSLVGEPRRQVLEISDINRERFEIKLRGHIESLIDAAAAPQLELMLRWLSDPEVTQRIEEESVALWQRIRNPADEADETSDEAAIDAFVDLKAATLLRELDKLGIPMLERTVLQADL